LTLEPTNFARVSPQVWRGARPTLDQAAWLCSQGVATVLSLEWEQDDIDLFPPEVRCFRVKDFEPLPWFAPSLARKHVDEALGIIATAKPITFLHCRSGSNRTGIIAAAYELLVLHRPLDVVLAHFRQYAGFWRLPDQRFIRRLATET
jgi:hypothetical protein